MKDLFLVCVLWGAGATSAEPRAAAAKGPPAPARVAKATEPAKEPSARHEALVEHLLREWEQGDVPAPFRWSVPGLLDTVEADGEMLSNGIPVLLQVARSNRSMQELMQHFVYSFEKAGLYIADPDEQLKQSGMPQLTGLDTQRLVSYTVILQANPDKTTTVVLGTARLAEMQGGVGEGVAWAPLMPGASQLLQTTTEGYDMAAYRAQSTPEQVEAFYRTALPRAGYAATEEPGVYRRGAEQLQVRMMPAEEGSGVVVMLQHRGVASPPAAGP